MRPLLITVNAGSATLKLSAWHVRERPACLWRVTVDTSGRKPPHWSISPGEAQPVLAAPGSDAVTHLGAVARGISAGDRVVAMAHRVVHGGDRHEGALVLTPSLHADLERLSPLAPLHQPVSLALAAAAARDWPAITQIACLDTAFHACQPAIARRYALPESFWDAGVKSFGFHGLSYASITRALQALDPGIARGRLLVAHLGNGASACAIDNGRSVATTMGFSALDGLVMGTRCGRIDPGVILYLQRGMGYDLKKIEDLLYQQAGLLGVSGSSADVRDLMAEDSPPARLALELFTYRAAREIASLMPALGEAPTALVFTGGIGEHQPAIRERIVHHLRGTGMAIDSKANALNARDISRSNAPLRVLVIPCDEEETMAMDSTRILTFINSH